MYLAIDAEVVAVKRRILPSIRHPVVDDGIDRVVARVREATLASSTDAAKVRENSHGAFPLVGDEIATDECPSGHSVTNTENWGIGCLHRSGLTAVRDDRTLCKCRFSARVDRPASGRAAQVADCDWLLRLPHAGSAANNSAAPHWVAISVLHFGKSDRRDWNCDA
jgi:hypothetical protein